LLFAHQPVLAGEVRFKSEGRASLQGWDIEVPWEKYDFKLINIGSSPADETPAFVCDLPGDGIEIDFRNEDFKTADGFGQGNIADPRLVTDLEAALDRAKRDVHFLYRIWVEGRREPIGIILTPFQIKVTRTESRVIVKLTNAALIERDGRIRY
jgi:hypothetical protein